MAARALAMNHGLERFAGSVCMKRERNVKRLGKKYEIRQGDVMMLPYPNKSYDVAMAPRRPYIFARWYGWISPDLSDAYARRQMDCRPRNGKPGKGKHVDKEM